ncbi:MAG: response regulator [Candidatus Hydrogenedentes bacterium]|nr:response regulator [Candidatus Hydrogenedentota bacterium]
MEMTDKVAARASQLYAADQGGLYRRTDRLFAGLMVFQWLGAVIMAALVSPRTWTGEMSQVHIHLWTAASLGGLLTIFPVFLVTVNPGTALTRHVIAISQTLFGAMLIHLSGGRIETHFHVFGSLAFLAFYRDWRVLVTATVIVAGDHFLRGMFWPQSVFGVLSSSQWRWLEHAAWVLFEDVILVASCQSGVRDMKHVAQRHAELEATNELIDAKVRQRTFELAQAHENLEDMVEERTEELQRTLVSLQEVNVELREANRHKSRFLSTMSHELRTPLNAIIGFADLLAGEGYGPLNEKQGKFVSRIDDSSTHLLALINDILDVARIDMGAMELTLESIESEEVLSDVHQMMLPQFEKRQIQLVLAEDRGHCCLRGDRRRLRQIVLNLLSNALKYAPAGSEVTLDCHTEDERLVRFTVADRGVGIEAEQLEHIFEEFKQANRERDEALGGIGLGLALTRRLVELQGGTIHVESVPGEGSTFWFTVPGAPSNILVPAALLPKEAEIPRTGREITVLVAEDNEVNMMMISDMLTLHGYTLLTARNGQECVDLARAHHPNLIITDVRMPVKDGLEAVRELRLEALFRDTPIIALTANASHVSREACLEAGCSHHLTKPIKSKELFPAIEYLLKTDKPQGVPAQA